MRPYAWLLVFATIWWRQTPSDGQDLNAFSVGWYKYLAISQNSNFMVSPVSAATALAVPYMGAVGETQQEFREVLFFDKNKEKNLANIGSLTKKLTDASFSPSTNLKIASMLWVQTDYPLAETFEKQVKTQLPDGIRRLDFKANAQVAAGIINQAIAKQTDDAIKNLVAPTQINAATKMMATNAAFFKGGWKYPFSPANTEVGTFYAANGTEERSAFLQTKSPQPYRYCQNDQLEVLEMPFADDRYAMLVVLPRLRDGLPNIAKTLSKSDYEKWVKDLKETQVIATIPKFSMSAEVPLHKLLQPMGMSVAFSNRANFSGLSMKDNDLKLGEIFHKSVIDVNEMGATASTATAVSVISRGIVESSAVVNFQADHGFLFLIKENEKNTILFIGQFTNTKELAVSFNPDADPSLSVVAQETPPQREDTEPNPQTASNKPANMVTPLGDYDTYTPSDGETPSQPEEEGTVDFIHQVQKGETIFQLSQRYGVSVEELARVNQLVNNIIAVGQDLKIPQEGQPQASAPYTWTDAAPTDVVHTVKAGETLTSIARQYNVSPQSILQKNALDTSAVFAGQQLRVTPAAKSQVTATFDPPQPTPTADCPNCLLHKVQKGETLFGIATKYSTSVKNLMALNQMTTPNVLEGATLIIRR